MIDLAGALALAAFGCLAVLSRKPGGAGLWPFLLLLAIAWGAVLWAFFAQRQETEKFLIRRIWFWGILFRLAGLLGAPILEDDYFRYLWDGRMFALTGNPYSTAPGDHFADANMPANFRAVLDAINHPDVPTIYAPVCQFVFLAGYWIAPGELWPLKIFLLLADLLTLRLLLGMAKPGNVLLYAWCPLLIKETAFTAHPDTLGILFLVAAVHGFTKNKPARVAVFCALAMGAKIFAAPLVPLLLWRAPKKYWLLYGGVWTALYLPFWVQGTAGDFAGLIAFLGQWEFNSTAFAVFSAWFGSQSARLLCGIIFGVFYVWFVMRFHAPHTRHHPIPRGDLLYGVFFLLAAVVNPWYLLWLLPFVAVFPSAAGVTALIAVSLSYAHGLNLGTQSLGAFEHPGWVRPAEFAAILLAAGWDWRRRLRTAAERNRDR